MKSAMKIRTKLMTTALVVDSPTPLAPPVVVKPQLQLTCNSLTQLLRWHQQLSLMLIQLVQCQ